MSQFGHVKDRIVSNEHAVDKDPRQTVNFPSVGLAYPRTWGRISSGGGPGLQNWWAALNGVAGRIVPDALPPPTLFEHKLTIRHQENAT